MAGLLRNPLVVFQGDMSTCLSTQERAQMTHRRTIRFTEIIYRRSIIKDPTPVWLTKQNIASCSWCSWTIYRQLRYGMASLPLSTACTALWGGHCECRVSLALSLRGCVLPPGGSNSHLEETATYWCLMVSQVSLVFQNLAFSQFSLS